MAREREIAFLFPLTAKIRNRRKRLHDEMTSPMVQSHVTLVNGHGRSDGHTVQVSRLQLLYEGEESMDAYSAAPLARAQCKRVTAE